MKLFTEDGIDYARLGMDDYEKIESDLRARIVGFLQERIAESKLPPESVFAAWNNARPDMVTRQQVWHYVANVRGGTVKALTLSLTKAGMDPAKIKDAINDLNMLDAGNLAAHLLGFEDRVKGLKGGQAPLPEPKQESASS